MSDIFRVFRSDESNYSISKADMDTAQTAFNTAQTKVNAAQAPYLAAARTAGVNVSGMASEADSVIEGCEQSKASLRALIQAKSSEARDDQFKLASAAQQGTGGLSGADRESFMLYADSVSKGMTVPQDEDISDNVKIALGALAERTKLLRTDINDLHKASASLEKQVGAQKDLEKKTYVFLSAANALGRAQDTLNSDRAAYTSDKATYEGALREKAQSGRAAEQTLNQIDPPAVSAEAAYEDNVNMVCIAPPSN